MKVAFAWSGWEATAGGGYTFVTEVLEAAFRNPIAGTEYSLAILDDSEVPEALAHIPSFRLERPVVQNASRAERLGRKLGLFSPSKTDDKRVGMRTSLGTLFNETADLLIFVYPGYLEDADLPQLAVIWDIAHRHMPYFPEISHQGTRRHREDFYQRMANAVDRLVVGTQRGVDELRLYYGVDPARIAVIPHPTPSAMVRLAPEAEKRNQSFRDRFAFYPAQFWAHKNHLTLLRAWKVLSERGIGDFRLVLVGKDYGNEAYMKEQARNLGISHLVDFRGFVSREELIELYRRSSLLVYPSLFGPENLPPLEAMCLGCPVLISDYPGAKEQLGEAARYVPALDENAWAEAIENSLKEPGQIRGQVEAGFKRALSWTADSFAGCLNGEISMLIRHRRLWKTCR